MVPTLHVVWVAAWELASGGTGVLVAWQLAAWPPLAGVALVTMAPLSYLVFRKWQPKYESRWSPWVTGIVLSILATATLGASVGRSLAGGVVSWLCGLAAAISFEFALTRRARAAEVDASGR